MKEKKENAQVAKLMQRAKEKGINLLPIMEFFIGWYDVKDSIKTVNELEHRYMWLYVSEEEAHEFRHEVKDHICFLNLLKQHLNDCCLN
jgi:hypothetical protein